MTAYLATVPATHVHQVGYHWDHKAWGHVGGGCPA